jgi:hypothetical protein
MHFPEDSQQVKAILELSWKTFGLKINYKLCDKHQRMLFVSDVHHRCEEFFQIFGRVLLPPRRIRSQLHRSLPKLSGKNASFLRKRPSLLSCYLLILVLFIHRINREDLFYWENAKCPTHRNLIYIECSLELVHILVAKIVVL